MFSRNFHEIESQVLAFFNINKLLYEKDIWNLET